MDFKLQKEERLYRKKHIEEIMLNGKIFRVDPFKVVFYKPERISDQESNLLKFGISVPKKLFKKAVDRNLLKRRTKEAFRLNRNSLKKRLIDKKMGLWIFFIYTNNRLIDYHSIEDKIILILQRLQAIHE